jgi:hypothetical protein
MPFFLIVIVCPLLLVIGLAFMFGQKKPDENNFIQRSEFLHTFFIGFMMVIVAIVIGFAYFIIQM